MLRRFVALCLSLTLVFSVSRAYAVLGVGDIVFDPNAFQRQLLNYMVYLRQYATQVRQYSTQIQQLENDYANLRDLGYKVDLSYLDQMQQVMGSSTGISNDFSRMQGQFQELYPDFNSYQGQDSSGYATQSAEWSRTNQQNAYDILTVTTRIKESIAQDQTRLKYLNDRSNTASGTKDLLQVMNQLLILQTKQLMQLEQLISTTAKADASFLAEKASDSEASRAASKNMFRGWTDKGARTPAPKPGTILQK